MPPRLQTRPPWPDRRAHELRRTNPPEPPARPMAREPSRRHALTGIGSARAAIGRSIGTPNGVRKETPKETKLRVPGRTGTPKSDPKAHAQKLRARKLRALKQPRLRPFPPMARLPSRQTPALRPARPRTGLRSSSRASSMEATMVIPASSAANSSRESPAVLRSTLSNSKTRASWT